MKAIKIILIILLCLSFPVFIAGWLYSNDVVFYTFMVFVAMIVGLLLFMRFIK